MKDMTYEQRMEAYARGTRTAVRVIAWIVSIFAVLALAGAVIIGIQIGKTASELGGGGPGSAGSICQSQGGTDPAC